jgi:hypothetical protein
MKNNLDIFDIARREGRLEQVLVYPGKDTINDPFEKTTDLTLMPALPVEAIVNQVSAEALHWKYYGQIPMKSIQVLAPIEMESLFRYARKIEYNGEQYQTMKDDSKNFLITKRKEYIAVILGLETTV